MARNHEARCVGSTSLKLKENNKSPTSSIITLERAFASRDQRKSPIQAQIDRASPEQRLFYWHSAAETGHAAMLAEMVQYYQDGHFDVDQLDGAGLSALHKAAKQGHHHVCRLLVKLGANVRVLDMQGKTPAQVARQHEQFECENYLNLLQEESTDYLQQIQASTLTSWCLQTKHTGAGCGSPRTLVQHSSRTARNRSKVWHDVSREGMLKNPGA